MSNEWARNDLVPFISVDPVITRASVLDALYIVYQYSQIDGAHHKAWCLDQVVRALTGSAYEDFVAWTKDGEDGPETYGWDEGIAP